MKRINGFVVILLVTVLLAACGGGGGGGGGVVAVTTNAPVISNLQYSPPGAYLNSGGGTSPLSATFDFSDPNSNASTLTILVFDTNGVMIDSSTDPVAGISGLPFGTIQISGAVDTTVLGSFTFQVYLTDATGLKSNVLSGTFKVSDFPWKTKATKPTAGTGVAAALNGIIYNLDAQYFESYNPTTNTWALKTSLPTWQGGFAAAAAVNGKFYVIGGASGSSVEEYDPLTDTWAPKAPMPTPRTNCSASVLNGKIYVMGGTSYSASTYLNTVEVYDPLTDTWSGAAPMQTTRVNLTTSMVNGKIYAIGGWTSIQSGTLSVLLSSVEEYNPLTNLWIARAPMPYPERARMISGAINGRIYVVGGWGLFGSISTTDEYDPVSDTWKRKTDMPTGPFSISTAAIDNMLYVFDGTVTYEYNPANDQL